MAKVLLGTLTGSGNMTVPLGVTKIMVELWGPGGGSYSNSTYTAGSGGGSGGYTKHNDFIAVTPGQVIPYAIGTGAYSTSAGITTFGTSGDPFYIYANGGRPGTGNGNSTVSGGNGGAAATDLSNVTALAGLKGGSTSNYNFGGKGAIAPNSGVSAANVNKPGNTPGGGAGGAENGGGGIQRPGGAGQINVYTDDGAPTYVGAGDRVSGTSAATVPFPSGVQSGDLLVLVRESHNLTTTPPAGWRLIKTYGIEGETSLMVAMKNYYTGMVEPQASSDLDHFTTRIYAWRGIGSNVAYAASAGSTANPTVDGVFPTLTVDGDKALILNVITQNVDSANSFISQSIPGTNWTTSAKIDDGGTTVGSGGAYAVISTFKAAAGPIGYASATKAASALSVSMTIAIYPTETPVDTGAMFLMF